MYHAKTVFVTEACTSGILNIILFRLELASAGYTLLVLFYVCSQDRNG